MLQPKDYIADWPDFDSRNFIEWLDGIDTKWHDKDAILYRGDGNTDFTRWSFGRLPPNVGGWLGGFWLWG
jgi:hypothetical protein